MKGIKIAQKITTRESKSVSRYFSDINKIPLLTTDEEYELACLSKDGDENAKEKLISHNLRFVISVAKQYETPKLKLEDLINEGNFGLIKAANKFDPSRGFKFISYAVWWIRKSILSYITHNSKFIRLPTNKITLNYKLQGKCEILEQKLQHKPTLSEILDEFGNEFNEAEVEFYVKSISSSVSSLDKTLGVDSNSTMVDLIEDGTSMSASYFVDKSDEKYNYKRILNLLTNERERQVIKFLFGLDGKEPLSISTLAFKLELTNSRIIQIRDSGLRKLKNILS